jgi:hypothetical protein
MKPWSWPQGPMPFKVFLRNVLGRMLPSVRTEKKCIEEFTEFLTWYREIIRNPLNHNHMWIRYHTFVRMAKEDWTPEQIIQERLQDGFVENEIHAWESLLSDWMQAKSKKTAQTGTPKFPMRFKVIIRWMVPWRRQHKFRIQVFQKYLYDFHQSRAVVRSLQPGDTPELYAKRKADDLIERLKHEGMNGPMDKISFFDTKHAVKEWRLKRKIQQRKEARASGILKEKRKKLLWVLVNLISAISSSEK